MSDDFFISYSSVDCKDFAIKLADKLEAGPPSIPVWLDKRSLRPAEDWDEQIEEAIKTCKGMLFVMSEDSVRPLSVCKNEWVRALKYKKPVIPILMDQDSELPFRLGSREYINFTGSFDSAMARLRNHLAWMDSPQGQLQALKYRLLDAQRELPRAEPEQQVRIQKDIDELKLQITQQQSVIDNPKAAEQRVQQSIEAGLELERKPNKPVDGITPGKVVNPPPLIAPTWFQDRHFESRQIGDFLKDESLRLMTVVGRGGVGKSAMVCRLLRSLEGGQLPDDLGPLPVDGIVYLSAAHSFHRTNVPDLYASLTKLLPDETVKQLDTIYRNPQSTTRTIMEALMQAFPSGRTVVLLDNFEDMLEAESGQVKDAELDNALRALLELPPHGLKIIATTRVALGGLAVVQPALQRRLDLDTGLEHPFAENILKEMDAYGKVGLKDAPEALLAEARERTLGYPRALEHLFGILSADRDTSLQDILNNTKQLLPEKVVEVLVGEAYSRLDLIAQRVMQALAIYRYPIPPAAVDYLLQSHVPGIASGRVLSRLVNMQFVHRDTGRYYLHQVDLDYALSRITEGDSSDRYAKVPPLTRFALRHRAAEWFELSRKPREAWKTLDDLAAQLSEFELRCEGYDYDTAALILLGIKDEVMTWGHYRQFISWYNELDTMVLDKQINIDCLLVIGTAYRRIGQHRKAIEVYDHGLEVMRTFDDRPVELNPFYINITTIYYDLGKRTLVLERMTRSLELAQQRQNRNFEAFCLSYISFTHRDLGQFHEALDAQQRVVAIYRGLGDKDSIEGELHNLASVFSDLGRDSEAIALYRESLELAKETRNALWKANHLGALGAQYGKMGWIDEAKQALRQALDLHQQIDTQVELGSNYTDIARVFLDHGEHAEALEYARKGVQLGMDLGIPLMGRHLVLALVHLHRGDISLAREAVESARQYDEPLNSPLMHLLSGTIALHERNKAAAKMAFETASQQAKELLSHCEANYEALDINSLALCGLVVCNEKVDVDQAIRNFENSRAITKAEGIVRRFEQLFSEIEKTDTNGLLRPMRMALSS